MLRLRLPLLAVLCLAFSAIAFGQVVYTTFPQIAVGGTWSCDFVINNQGFEQVTGLRLSLFGDSGDPLVVNSDLGANSVFEFDLAPGETKTIRISSSGGVTAGYAVLRRPFPAPVSATLVVRYKNGAKVETQLGVPHQETHTSFSFAGEVNLAQGTSTGIAIAYPTFAGSQPQTVVISLIQPDGAVSGRTTLTLQPGTHTQGFLNDPNLFPGLNVFSGTVSVSGPRRFGLVAMRLEGSALGTVSINRGAVLSPGKCSAQPIPEAEPNDMTPLAQVLAPPALIEGVIDPSGDVDYFSVSGQQGDILTLMAETQGTDSWADTVITVEDSSGTLIGTNDQNGLYGQNDSFFQMVLPASGVYYIQVGDYWDDGGYQYIYRLHAILTPTGPVSTTPSIQALLPSSGQVGASVDISIVGSNLSGATAINLSPSAGITVSNLQSTATTVTARLTIASGATPGARQLTVTTPEGTSNALTFTVSSGGGNAPVINSLIPSSWPAGKAVEITINGTNLSGVTAVNLSPSTGISVSGIQSTSFSVTATLTIAAGAAAGDRQLTVTTSGGTSNSVTFRVSSGSTTGYNGVWTGTTGQGKPLTFLIEDDHLKYVKFGATISGSGCTSNVTSQTSFSNMPLAGTLIGFSVTGGPGGTSLDVTGSFTSTTSASGTAEITLHSIPGR